MNIRSVLGTNASVYTYVSAARIYCVYVQYTTIFNTNDGVQLKECVADFTGNIKILHLFQQNTPAGNII